MADACTFYRERVCVFILKPLSSVMHYTSCIVFSVPPSTFLSNDPFTHSHLMTRSLYSSYAVYK